MRRFLKLLYIVVALTFLIYLALPGPDFPEPLPDAVQSTEPGDTETPLRRAYFTNYTREEVMEHYMGEFDTLPVFNLSVPTYRLNYPPEEAQTLIRDQTRSTFLEEIVHPFRESVYVNGFKPTKNKDAIIIEGEEWLQKVTVRHVPSNPIYRVGVGLFASIFLWVLFFELKNTIEVFKERVPWIYQ